MGSALDTYAFAIAAWMRYALGRSEAGERYALRDPREEEITGAVDRHQSAAEIAGRLFALPGLFPATLAASRTFAEAVTHQLGLMLAEGMRTAIRREAERCRA